MIFSFAQLFLKDPDEVGRELKSTASIVEILHPGGVKVRGTAKIWDGRAARKNFKCKEKKILDRIHVHLGYKPL